MDFDGFSRQGRRCRNHFSSSFSVKNYDTTYLTKSLFFANFYNTAKNALVAQLAEHIHGKDKVISSILIEG